MSERKRTRKRLFAAAFLAACLDQSTFAADLPSRKMPAIAVPPVFSWTGLYIGLNFGHAFQAANNIDVTSWNAIDATPLRWGAYSAIGATARVNARLDGFFNGGQIGYNWQSLETFVGVEADMQGAGIRGGGGFGHIVGLPSAAFATTANTSGRLHRSLEYFATVRGRLGYAITPPLLAYVTGGLAYGGISSSIAINQSIHPTLLVGQNARGAAFENRAGWTLGAGFEWAFARHLSAKLEYLYYDLGSFILSNPSSPMAQTNIAGALQILNATTTATRFNGHILRAGLNYRFDWSEPASSGAAMMPVFASPEFLSVKRPNMDGWRFSLMPYTWMVNVNGNSTTAGQTIGTNLTFIDALTTSSAFPLAFMGRLEARNGPVAFYGDLVWEQMRFSGSTFGIRSPFADIAIATSGNGRLKQTMAIGEAGGSYEFERWKFADAPDSYTAFDAFAGFRYWYLGLDLTLDVLNLAASDFLGISRLGGKAIAKSGDVQWIDPVVGLGIRHRVSPGNEFYLRGDIGGFGVGSKFSWQAAAGLDHDFTVASWNLAGSIGYRALGVDFATGSGNRQNGMNTVIHGPTCGMKVRF